jgi:large subunit ribosomal protein L29
VPKALAEISKLAAQGSELIMKVDKIRNLTDAELQHQERDLADQLFKLKFQLNMGQTESLKKIRGLRRDIARVKTILGERVRSAAAEKK